MPAARTLYIKCRFSRRVSTVENYFSRRAATIHGRCNHFAIFCIPISIALSGLFIKPPTISWSAVIAATTTATEIVSFVGSSFAKKRSMSVVLPVNACSNFIPKKAIAQKKQRGFKTEPTRLKYLFLISYSIRILSVSIRILSVSIRILSISICIDAVSASNLSIWMRSESFAKYSHVSFWRWQRWIRLLKQTRLLEKHYT